MTDPNVTAPDGQDAVLIAVDDNELLPPRSCAWFLIAPCGCSIAVTTAACSNGLMIHDKNRALRELVDPNNERYAQEARERGYRVELDRLTRVADIGCVHVQAAMSA